MKKLLVVFLSIIMILSATACAANETSEDESTNNEANTETNTETNTDTSTDTSEDTSDEVTKIYPNTWYEASMQSGDATIKAYFILSNLDNKAAVNEPDPIGARDAEFTVEGNVVTVSINDDLASELHTYVFEKSGDNLIYKADSSDQLYYLGSAWDETAELQEPVADGTEFVATVYDSYETATYADSYSTVEIDVEAMTIKFTSTDGVEMEGPLTFDCMGAIYVESDEYFMNAYKMSDEEFQVSVRSKADISVAAGGILTIVKE